MFQDFIIVIEIIVIELIVGDFSNNYIILIFNYKRLSWNMKLNYKLQGIGQPIVFLHGVFGSLDNLNMLAKDLVSDFQTIQVDLRNHGQSPWSDQINYPAMAQDVADLCHELQLKDIILIGHSMGGKVAMQLSQVIPQLIQKIVVIDIAPVKYSSSPNAIILRTLMYCQNNQITDRKQIMAVMQEAGLSEATCLFLLKSYKNQHWLFNLQTINDQYANICDWQTIPSTSPCLKPILFIRGGNSVYLADKYQDTIYAQFPNAKIVTIEGAGHNVHAEKTQQVLQLLHDWLNCSSDDV